MNKEIEFMEKLRDAEMILIGLGEEFDCLLNLRQEEDYCRKRAVLETGDNAWMIPALNQIYGHVEYEAVREKLQRLAEVLAKKNYFVVSTSVNDVIGEISWREGRFVMPCGNGRLKQCVAGCENSITEVTGEEQGRLEHYLENMEMDQSPMQAARTEDVFGILGNCPVCGRNMVLNNIYCNKYEESGYLERWAIYTKWLQGTLNRRLLVLELGVTMQCPSVIRWPFEKIVYFNQKAFMYRVNEKLYHLTEELREKGVGISQNAIDWLEFLC